MAVGANEDLRPRANGCGSPAPGDAETPGSRRPSAAWPGAEGGDEAALAIEDDDRLEAVFVVMGVEQAQLLAAVHRVEGVVDIEHDALRHLAERAALDVDQGPAQAQQRATSGRFSSREMVDCEHRSRSEGGVRAPA